MRFARGDVKGTISFHPKSITDLRSGAKERCSRREAQRSTFARFFGLFDFRLLQQYRHKTDMPLPKPDVRCSEKSGRGQGAIGLPLMDPCQTSETVKGLRQKRSTATVE